MLRIDAVRKEYGGITAVKNVSFEIEPRTVFGLLGPNGAGKSTLLDIILGYTVPTSGSVTVAGHDVTEKSVAVRERTGVLPEATAVYDRLTGREHVQMASDIKNVDVETSELLSTVGLSETEADQRAGGYSKGMCQRLLLATALVGDPDLLVLDEPSSGLDPNGARELREIIQRRATDGTTVLFSTHRLPEAEAVCDRVGILDDGELVETTDVATLTSERQTTVNFEVASSPSPVANEIRTLDGVTSVTTDDEAQKLTVSVTDAAAKVPVFRLVDEAVTVRDFWVERTSMDEVFEASVGETRVQSNGTASLVDTDGGS
jgi:ABC-2 type transport system ATP-binding protein